MKTSNVAEFLLDRLADLGIKFIFMIPGAHIDPVTVLIASDNRFKLVIAAHESGAAYMADGLARISGLPAAVFSIGGPGATNMITAAITCKLDKIPVLFITGDSPNLLENMDAFQNSGRLGSNVVSIFAEGIGNSFCIRSGKELAIRLRQFADNCESGSSLPFHFSLPFDVSLQDFAEIPHEKQGHENAMNGDDAVFCHAGAPDCIPPHVPEKTVIYAGSEVLKAKDREVLIRLATDYQIPVAVTLEAKGILSMLPEHLRIGVFGYAGCPFAFDVLLAEDLEMLIMAGVILNERNSACWDPELFSTRRIILGSAAEAHKITWLNQHQSAFFNSPEVLCDALRSRWNNCSAAAHRVEARLKWLAKFDKNALTLVDRHDETASPMPMRSVMAVMQSELPDDTALFLDSGEHRYFVGRYWNPPQPDSLYTASQSAPMGWAVAAAIGASFAVANKRIYVLTGDGCMMMHGMELAVAARYGCNVTVMVSSNSSYGRIKSRFRGLGEELSDQIVQLPVVSWVGFAESFGVMSYRATNVAELVRALTDSRKQKGPCLIEMVTIGGDDVDFNRSSFTASSQKFLDEWNRTAE